MLIVSDFHDYYDSALGYGGVDKSIVYNRKKKEIKFENKRDYKFTPEYKNFFQFFENLYKPFGVFIKNRKYYNINYNIINCEYINILFCGELYSCICVTIEVNNTVQHVQCCYNFNSLENLIKEYGTKYDYNILTQSSYCFDARKNLRNDDRLALFFNNNVPKNIIIEFHQKHKCPIIINMDNEYRNRNIVLNPCLKNLEFAQIHDPFQAFQRIEMFISGILGADQKELVEIDDIHQRDKKGFNEMSFKNMPREE